MHRAAPEISSHKQLLEETRTRLPEALRGHVVQVLEKSEELVILADSAAWAARVRLALAGDRSARPGGRIVVKVAPRNTPGT